MDSGKEPNYWPGFVDALSNVVLTLVFVLVIFVFALLMASQKVKAKMAEVETAEKGQQASQAQLNQALAELEKMHSEDSSSSSSSTSSSCLKFNKSDASQHSEVDPDGMTIALFFSTNAITVTDDTTKAVHDFIDSVHTKLNITTDRFSIEASSDPDAPSQSMAKELQLGRMLNVRNTLLGNKVLPLNITMHSVDPLQVSGSYNWVKIHVEK